MDAENRRERAGAEASRWWVMLNDPDVPMAQLEQYVDWLRESPLHVVAMMRVATVHGRLQRFPHWNLINPSGSLQDDPVVDFPSPSIPSLPAFPPDPGAAATPAGSKGGRRRWVAVAASLIVILGAVLIYMHRLADMVRTERGERRELILADGSVVQIDPKSALRLKLNGAQRRVVLERGRAWFKVAQDPVRPFVVEAQGTVIRALGTAFAVERQKAGVRVTVAEGRVSVSPRTTPESGVASAEGGSPPVLTANEQVTVQKSGSAGPVRKVDVTKELAWTKGRLFFDNRPVSEVVEEFNRYNPVQLEVADAELRVIPVLGVFDASDPDSFVAFLESVAAVSVERRDGETMVLKKSR